MDSFVQIVSTVGFPIACCIAMGLFVKYVIDISREERKELTDAINNNTLIIQRLYDKLGD